METTKRLIEAVFSPFGITLILLGLGIFLRIVARHSRAGCRLLVVGGLFLFISLFTPLSPYLNWRLERQFQPMLTPPESPRVGRIAILAGYGEEHPGIPITSDVSSLTIGSVTEGLRLYRLLPGAKLIMSGGAVQGGGSDKPVAALMADFLQQMGVPSADIIVQGNSRNTYEDLAGIKEIVGTEPFILVAAGYHLRRAVGVAKHLRMNPIPAPSCIWTLQDYPRDLNATEQLILFSKKIGRHSSEDLFRLQLAYHEYMGYIWYQLLDRI
jgi:uncharacterized SAM-binding protein YcdF (DUF218 family)